MPKGGARPGAGRPKGSKTRKITIRNINPTLTKAAVMKLNEIVGSDQDPLWTCIRAANDPELDITVRLMACSVCLPYLRPRLTAAMVAKVPVGPSHESRRVVEELIARLQAPAMVETIEHVADPPSAEVVQLRKGT